MEVICITGTPGTGKTTLAKKLAKKLDFCYLDVNESIKYLKQRIELLRNAAKQAEENQVKEEKILGDIER